ncbi:hypothetical protein MTO96_022551 [Rhipicephalus appendiculatus]
MDRLRRNRGVVRAAATRLITSAAEALQLENPAPAGLQVILDDLQDKDTTLADLNKNISDLITDGAEYEEELTAALEYHDKIRNTMSRIRYLLNSATRPADSTTPVVATETGSQGVSAQGGLPDHHDSRRDSWSTYREELLLQMCQGRACRTTVSQRRVAKGKHCAKRHLTVLCEIWKPESHAIATSSDTTKTDSVSVTTSAPASSFTPPSPAVLMQTATVWASGRHDSVLARILLDTGSQRTFIRRDLSMSLDLPSVGTEDLILILLTFGSSNNSRTHRYRTVQLKLQSRFDTPEITVDALEVPEVCTVKTPAIGQGLLMQLHERKMLIADEQRIGHRPTQTNSVIIGSHNYWRIVTGKI